MNKDKYIEGFRGLAVYQIAGGVLGLYFSAKSLLIYAQAQTLPSLFHFIGLALFVFSIYCGIILFQHRVNSLQYSMANQYLQLISFAGSGLVFKSVSGLAISLDLVNSGSLSFNFNFSLSSAYLSVTTDPITRYVGLNIIAGGIILILHAELKSLDRERLEDKIKDIGS